MDEPFPPKATLAKERRLLGAHENQAESLLRIVKPIGARMPLLQEKGHYGESVPHIGNLPEIDSIGIFFRPAYSGFDQQCLPFIGVGRGGESPSSVRLVQSRRVQPTDHGFN